MGSDGSLVFQLIFIVFLIFINAFFSASEIAIISLNDNRLRKSAEDGVKKARILVKLLSKPSSFLAAIQVGITISGLLSSAVASESFSNNIVSALSFLPLSTSVIKIFSVIIITFFLSFFTPVFGELLPKRLAMHNPEGIALGAVGVLHAVSVICKPFVNFLAFSTNVLAKPFGVAPEAKEVNVTEEEIRLMVDVGEENGTIEESEKEMINNIFEFSDRTAGDIMTHRTEISAIEVTSPIDEIIKIGVTEGYSRIPVFEDDLDNIVGVINVKDLSNLIVKPLDEKFDVKDFMRPALFVPETKKCRELFKVLTAKKQHIAVVIDEYGGTAGIVTMEDLLEAIVGDIQDEYDDEEDDFSVIDEANYTIDGSVDLEEVSEIIGVDLPAGVYDTLAGFIIDILGRIPDENEHPSVDFDGVTFTVEQVDDRRIEKVHVRKAPMHSETAQQ